LDLLVTVMACAFAWVSMIGSVVRIKVITMIFILMYIFIGRKKEYIAWNIVVVVVVVGGVLFGSPFPLAAFFFFQLTENIEN
ncbi:hypothetical protein, partial [Klebsiella aerogenes]|uniref:hypothetical protein n=1 Tax=Klebsiella aerogenes TaxID=548 RepID=UPI001CC50003